MTGWFDPIPNGGDSINIADIAMYEVEAWEIVAQSSAQLPMSTINHLSVTQDSVITSITLPIEPMLYAVILTVKDNADNIREARRLVLYDASSTIELDSGLQMNAQTGVASAQYVWQDNNNEVIWRWDGFFYNSYYKVHDVLKPITQDTTRWSGDFEQLTGVLNVLGTDNIDGLVIFEYYQADNEDYVPTANEFTQVTNTEYVDESMHVVSSCSDGDKYIMWMKVTDIMSRTRTEFCNIYVDSSPPILTQFGIENNGHDMLFVHSTDDWTHMVLEYEAFDLHSNIYTMQWTLGTSPDASDVGSGSMAVVKYAKDVSRH
jgi:hypothetical protein